jgi:predicted RNA-binding Zn-ribbon protein involved in translation (DUF1610 family)
MHRRYHYVGPEEIRRSAISPGAADVASAGIAAPDGYTDPVVFRHCPSCGERNIVRDADFTCALCAGDLPASWNFADD